MSEIKKTPLVVTLSFVTMFILMVLMIIAGGTVRLTGSGLSIPDWPKINGRYMPPSTDAEWTIVKKSFDEDQLRMMEMGVNRVPGVGYKGKAPDNLEEFKTMFLIEWSHRAIAFVLGINAIICLGVVCVYADTRKRAALSMSAVVLLIGIQAVIGGILVKTGTSTHWLFIHLTMATIIIALMAWSFLRARNTPAEMSETFGPSSMSQLRKLKVFVLVAMGLVLVQIILGALVAGSRHNGGIVAEWPLMHGAVIPTLWDSGLGFMNNLLDNAVLHQWLHRWFAWVVVIKLVLVYRIAFAMPALPKVTSRSLKVSAALLGFQVLLGLSNVFMSAPIYIALVHLLTALLIIVCLTCAAYGLLRLRCVRAQGSQSEAKLSSVVGGGSGS